MSLVFHRILVPIDFSEPAATALHYAKALAGQMGGELHLLHVCDDPLVLADWPVSAPAPVAETGKEADALRAQLARLLTDDERQALRAEVHVAVGRPTGMAISRYAADHEFELVVMGTHGRTGLSHALMGSVAEQVVRSAPCPVLTIRNPVHRKLAVERLRAPAAE